MWTVGGKKFQQTTGCTDIDKAKSAFAASMTKEGKSGNTVNKYLNLLTLVFRVLKKPARLSANPWEDIQRKWATAAPP